MTVLPIGSRPLAGTSVEELLRMAGEFDAMALSAATPDAKQALARLAASLRVFAATRASRCGPADLAIPPPPESGLTPLSLLITDEPAIRVVIEASTS